MGIYRSTKNPIITPADINPSQAEFKIAGVFNCGVTRFNGEILLLMRVAETPLNNNPIKKLVPLLDVCTGKYIIKEFDATDSAIDLSDSRLVKTPFGQYLTSISHLRIARSKNGIDFIIDKKPAMFPDNEYERLGIEDPRITHINDRFYISYSSISDLTGVTVSLASTTDFITFKRHGIIFTPDNKDVAIFPEKINGKFYALNRPASAEYAARDIWISRSSDLVCWGNHLRLIGVRQGFWDNGRIGCGAVTFRTKQGWMEIYHGSSRENKYCIGAVLLDIDKPWEVIARSVMPLMEPEKDYEVNGFFGNVVFTCGVLYEEGIVNIYYGAADTSISYAKIWLKDLLYHLR